MKKFIRLFVAVFISVFIADIIQGFIITFLYTPSIASTETVEIATFARYLILAFTLSMVLWIVYNGKNFFNLRKKCNV